MIVWLMLCGAALVFLLPLHHRDRFGLRLVLCCAAALPVVYLQRAGQASTAWLLAVAVFCLLWGTAASYCCAELDWTAACYCGIWLLPIMEFTYELWQILELIVIDRLLLPAALPKGAVFALFAAVCYAVVFGTIARSMPMEGDYHIGPRQLLSAVVLGGISLVQFLSLQRIWLMPADVRGQLAAPAFLTQLYCVTLLYLQTELFKKSAMQKEMDALNLLYDRQRQQYRVARQNVQIINKKCHELKVQIADLRRLNPGEAARKSLDEAEEAVRLYDADVHTGNEVLDVALTEKSLLCESHGIRLHCVADGSCLERLEPADLYALFANALDPAIESVSRLGNTDRAAIDLLVCGRQGFAVINIVAPAFPEAAHRSVRYEFKVVRRIVQKYGGTATMETRDGFTALKILLPLPAQDS